MESGLADAVSDAAHPLEGAADDYDPLLELIGDARFVLLGEASHGTQQFYRERAEITKRLIREKGFNVVAVEADWPDAYRVNRYVRGVGEDENADEALSGFGRFPTWMWRNTVVLDFVEWLQGYNTGLGDEDTPAGFYGLDLYSMYGSIAAVVDYLDEVDPEAADRARYRYACFEHYGEDTQAYAHAARIDTSRRCEDEAVTQLTDLRRRAAEYARRDGRIPEDEYFYAEQNARLVKNAEEYYRSMFRGRTESWNLRDRHMADTLDALVEHLEGKGVEPKVAVWEHNSHLGDARATDVGERGQLNVGQLVRERHDADAVLVGFTTHEGTVTAASNWDGPAESKRVRPSQEDSYERVFHDAGMPRFLLRLRGADIGERLPERIERAIGVVYRPATERLSHYFHARLPEQFDTVLHFDETSALEPLERTPEWEADEPPETFPSGV